MFVTRDLPVRVVQERQAAPRNPWGGSSLEWQAPTPPPLYNFEKPPVLHELYNYDDLVEVEEDVWERHAPHRGRAGGGAGRRACPREAGAASAEPEPRRSKATNGLTAAKPAGPADRAAGEDDE